ncbi:nuclear transport factor 2 family protein [Microbacterium timonense]|uniref:nuclear transport factor 2 family protein n=1 Tax=Microbacterium timonense TaxID=2086576 RepID=UPI000D0FF6C8|nr:nuclear transport factor 2 family protein [Microbacterium timonense]
MSDDVPAAIRDFLDSTNRADTDAFLAVFTNDAVLDDWGRTFHGRDGIRDWNRTDNIGVQAHIDLVSCRALEPAGVYEARVSVSSGRFNGTGTMTFTVTGDRIASLRIT